MKRSQKTQENTGPDKTIGEIVADDCRTAKVFEKYGIDFRGRLGHPLKTLKKDP